MSNSIDKNLNSDSNADLKNTEPKKVESKDSAKFGLINQDLKSALDTWSELSEKLAGKISPEEAQMAEIKKLLGDLKSKLKDFA